MFARRTAWDVSLNPLARRLADLRARGGSILDLTLSNPTEAGFSVPPPTILRFLDRPESLRYHPDPKGLPAARQAVAEYHAASGITVSPESIFLTAGTSEAYLDILRLLCDPGDSIAVPSPGYPLLQFLGDAADVTVLPYRIDFHGRWELDRASVEGRIREGARAVILAHPNNPTGSWISAEDFAAISSFAARHECALIVDEVFSPYALDDSSAIPSVLRWDAPALTFVLTGISKLLGLPQLKLSWTVVQGPPALVEEALSRLDILLDATLSVGTPVQEALRDLLAFAPEVRKEIRRRLRSNLATLTQLTANSAVTLFPVEAGWYAILRLPERKADETWAIELLDRAGVLTHPGHLFDIALPSCLVVSLLVPPHSFERGNLEVVRAVSGVE